MQWTHINMPIIWPKWPRIWPKNLTTDLGEAALNNKGLHSKDFFQKCIWSVGID